MTYTFFRAELLPVFEDESDPSYMPDKFEPRSNYFTPYLATVGLTGYATHGDDPRAEDQITKAMALWENYMLPVYQGETSELTGDPYPRRADYVWDAWGLPTLEHGPPSLKGGDYREGTEYGQHAWESVLFYPEAVLSATGENLFDDFTWSKSLIYSRAHWIHPAMASEYDGTRDSDTSVKNLREQLLLSYIYRSEPEGGYAQYILRHAQSGSYPYFWQFPKFLWYDPNLPERSLQELDLSYLIEGPGLAFIRSGWEDENATWVAFQGGFEFADNARYIGNFEIVSRGEELVISVHKDWPQHSDQYNTVLIYDNGDYNGTSRPGVQSAYGTECIMEAFEDGGDYVYARSDLKDAYRFSKTDTSRTPLSNYRRHFVYIRPDYFVVFDRLSTKKAEYGKESRMYFPAEPQLDGQGGFSIAINSARLFGKALLPGNLNLDKVASDMSPAGSWRIEITPTIQQMYDLFLQVLQTTDSTTASMVPTERIDSTTNNMIGARISNSIVMFAQEEKVLSENIIYQLSGTGTSKHLIVDLKPNTQFTITVDAGNAEEYTTTEAGILSFNLNLSGTHSVTIAQGNPDTQPPAVPTGLTAIPDIGVINLSWSANTESDLAGYNVYRRLAGQISFTKQNTTVLTTTNYQDTSVVTGQSYEYVVRSIDFAGNESGNSNMVTASPLADTTPPVISNVAASSVADTQATIAWQTDEPGDSQVEYGLTTSYGSSTALDTNLVTNHSQTVSGLLPDTLYHYRVKSRDASDNLTVSQDFTFMTEAQVYENIFSGIPGFGDANNWTPRTLSYWSVVDDPTSSDPTNRAYFLSDDAARPNYEYSLFDSTYTDFTLTAKARTGELASIVWRDYIIIFGFRDDSNYYFASFNAQDDNQTNGIFKTENGIAIELSTLGLPPTITDSNYHNIEIARQGSNITVSMDGEVRFIAQDSTFGAGRIGLGSYNDSAYFDDVNVSVVSGNIPPTAIASADITSGQTPLTVNFTGSGSDPDGTIASYSWDFGNGTSSNLQNPSYTYSNSGTYTATLTVTDNEGATGVDSLTIVVGAEGNVYYVDPSGSDSNSGTQGEPWRTLQHAANIAQAGDTVLVNNGTYSGYETVRSGNVSNPIRFKANGTSVVINSSSNRDNIEIYRTDYIVIDGFKVQNASRAGIAVLEARGVTVQNCMVADNQKWGIFSAFADEVKILNNTVSGSREQHGVYVSNSGDYPTVSGNTIYDNSICGLHMNGDVYMGGDGVISHALVENNIIYNNGVSGGAGINCDGVTDSVIRNNLLYNNHANGIALYRIDGGAESNNNKVYHNTIIMASDGRWAIALHDGSSVNKIYNNILLTHHSLRGSIHAHSITGLESDYNIFTTNSNAVTPDDDASYLTFQEWQALGYDQSSLQATVEEVFANPSQDNYQLTENSLATDRGSLAYTYSEDILGNLRPQGSGSDIGAYEYPVQGIRGDVNADGVVNVVDVQLAVNQFLGVIPQTQEADLNGDGVVNVIDVQLVVNIILSLAT